LIAQNTIKGTVIDGESEDTLPYTSVAFVATGGGTTSNQEGAFSIRISDEGMKDSLSFSYIGYDTYVVAVSDIRSPLSVRLIPSANLLKEVIVRPMTPEDYLKQVIRKVSLNQADSPFNTTAYYREEIKEGGEYLRHSEGVFQSGYTSFQAKSESKHQLVLYRENKETQKLKFMADKAEKERSKHLKEHPEDSLKFEENELLINSLGGPAVVINIHVGNKSISFLDSLEFRHFRYSYGPETSFAGRDMITLDFESKGAVNNVRSKGQIIIDKNSDAVVAIKWSGNIVIPVLVRPILFALGLSIESPTFRAEARFQEKDERWYPQQVRTHINLKATKKHMFKKNQKGDFDISQLFVVNDLNRDRPFDIPKSVQFDPNEKMKDQVYWDGNSDWSEVNVVD